MKIEKMIATKGLGGYLWMDRAAIKSGAQKDGLIYKGEPMTPGFDSIVVPAEAICVQLVLDDGQIAYGDCVAVVYSGGWGRDPFFKVDSYLPVVNQGLAPLVEGLELENFRKTAAYVDGLLLEGSKLHTAIRYGMTQAILDATAKARRVTMAEVLADEYDLTLADSPIPIFGQTGVEFYSNTEKMILLKLPVLPHSSTKTLEDFKDLPNKVKWTRHRAREMGGENYNPKLHFDVYGTIGSFLEHKIPEMIAYLKELADACEPLDLIIEAPVEMDTQEEHIHMMKTLRRALDDEGIKITIAADEWCNNLHDVKRFVDAGAVDMVNIKTPDLGGINNTIEAVLYCQKKGVLAYLGGSAAETERCAQICAHLALATWPCQIMERPGSGVFEGTSIVFNEMQRALALIASRLA